MGWTEEECGRGWRSEVGGPAYASARYRVELARTVLWTVGYGIGSQRYGEDSTVMEMHDHDSGSALPS